MYGSSSSIATPNDAESVPEARIDNYSFYGYISEGSYCKVRIVQSKLDKKFYALKYMPQTQSTSRVRSIVHERNILANLRHSLISNMHYAFQDRGFYFMVLDLMRGGDLRHYLNNYKLSAQATRVLIGEVASAIEYIHEKRLIHRDVKPENILLDEKGHAHLCDFNVAVELSCESPLAKRAIGTFNYLAPEVHRRQPYGEQVDWWALGVVFYECTYGEVPFRGKTKEEMISLIVRGPRFKKITPAVSKTCIQAIKRFLQLHPYERIRDAYDVFSLDFFKSLNPAEIPTQAALEATGAFGLLTHEFLDMSIRHCRQKVLNHDIADWGRERSQSQHAHRNGDVGTGSRLKNRLRIYSERLNERISTRSGRLVDSCDANFMGRDSDASLTFRIFNCQQSDREYGSKAVDVPGTECAPSSKWSATAASSISSLTTASDSSAVSPRILSSSPISPAGISPFGLGGSFLKSMPNLTHLPVRSVASVPSCLDLPERIVEHASE